MSWSWHNRAVPVGLVSVIRRTSAAVLAGTVYNVPYPAVDTYAPSMGFAVPPAEKNSLSRSAMVAPAGSGAPQSRVVVLRPTPTCRPPLVVLTPPAVADTYYFVPATKPDKPVT